jgi:hypothetical protein
MHALHQAARAERLVVGMRRDDQEPLGRADARLGKVRRSAQRCG